MGLGVFQPKLVSSAPFLSQPNTCSPEVVPLCWKILLAYASPDKIPPSSPRYELCSSLWPGTPRNLIVPKKGQKGTNVITNLWSKKWSHLSSRTQGRTDIKSIFGLQLNAAGLNTRSSLLTNLLISITSHIHPNPVVKGRRRFSK